MTRRPAQDAAGAGALLIAAIALCSAIGLGLGVLIGAPVPFGLAGGFVGVAVGFRIVYSRFKHL